MTAPAPIRNAKDLGAALRHARRTATATQQELANLTQVSVKFLSELERGKDSAALGLALRALERVGLTVWIVPRGWSPPTPPTAFPLTYRQELGGDP